MGKKRIVKKGGEGGGGTAASSRAPKRKLESGILFVEATYNNTKVSLGDPQGNILLWSSSGALGFSGAKKGTPFAAAKVGELIGERAGQMGVREVAVVVKGVGAGRESSIRAFSTKGIHISTIKDTTPVPHNGPRAPKPRRV
ncbi:MAG TPA: 30S ribosomal protein S11 [Candidatus Paceibacterota bacterium]|nr:30S ribosomal protein S11 [Candidatus Paceibacterota bacterium]